MLKHVLEKGRILDVAYVPESTQFAVASPTGIWFYDVNTLEERGVISENAGNKFSMSFSPDGKTLATVDGGKTIHIWNMETLQHRTTFIRDAFLMPRFVFDYVSFVGEGHTLASRYIGGVDLWDMTTYTHHSELTGPQTRGNMAFSPSGRIMAYSGSKHISLWDVITDKPKGGLVGHTKSIKSLTFSPDGETLASGSNDNTIILWDVESHELKKTINAHKQSVVSIAFSPDGETLASGSIDRTVKLWDVAKGKRKKTFKKHSSAIHKVLFSPDGKTLLSYCEDSIIHQWDVDTSKYKNTFNDHNYYATSISFSPDGLTIASGSWDKTIRLWDANTGKHKMALEGHKSAVSSVSFSPDGLTIASGSWDKTIRLWDVPTGQHRKTLQGHTNEIQSVRLSPDGRFVASRSRRSVRLWDVSAGRQKYKFDVEQSSGFLNTGLAFTPDGKYLVSTGKAALIYMWDVSIGKLTRTFKWNKGTLEDLAFSPDGKTLVSGGT